MIRRGNKIVLLVIMVFILAFFSCFNKRTPHKIASEQSGLKLSKTIKILDFKENYSDTGEGFIYIVFGLTDKEFDNILKESINLNYKKLSVVNLVNDGFLDEDPNYGLKLYNKDIRDVEGYYKLTAKDLSSMDFSISVIDEVNSQLIVYVSFP